MKRTGITKRVQKETSSGVGDKAPLIIDEEQKSFLRKRISPKEFLLEKGEFCLVC